MTAPYADLIERLRDPHFRGAMQYLRGWTDLDDMHDDAAKAIEALQAEVERLSAAPPASVGGEEIARMLRDMIYLQSIDTDHRVVGYEHAADAILAALAPTPPEGEG